MVGVQPAAGRQEDREALGSVVGGFLDRGPLSSEGSSMGRAVGGGSRQGPGAES